MTNLVITNQDVKEKMNQVIAEMGESRVYQFALYNAMRNIKNGFVSSGDPCTPKYSLASDEWDICELWRVKGLEFAQSAPALYEDMVEWYYGSTAEKVCASAYAVASFYSDKEFFTFDPEDNEAEHLARLQQDLVRPETLEVALEYWVREQNEVTIYDMFHFTDLVNGIPATSIPPTKKYYICVNPDDGPVILLKDGKRGANAEHALANNLALTFTDLQKAIKFAQDFFDKREAESECPYVGVVSYDVDFSKGWCEETTPTYFELAHNWDEE